MRKTKVIITDDLVEDLKTYSGAICKHLATNTRDQLYTATADAVQSFYDDYDPVSYKRHNHETGRRPYNFEEKSFSKYYKNPHGSIYRGGVKLSSENMEDIYQDSTEEVFDMFYHGIHGVASGFVEPKTFSVIPDVMQPSPLELIKEKQKQLKEDSWKYKASAMKEAGKLSYKTFV